MTKNVKNIPNDATEQNSNGHDMRSIVVVMLVDDFLSV